MMIHEETKMHKVFHRIELYTSTEIPRVGQHSGLGLDKSESWFKVRFNVQAEITIRIMANL